jgi:hypothetical protein
MLELRWMTGACDIRERGCSGAALQNSSLLELTMPVRGKDFKLHVTISIITF